MLLIQPDSLEIVLMVTVIVLKQNFCLGLSDYHQRKYELTCLTSSSNGYITVTMVTAMLITKMIQIITIVIKT